MTEIIAKLVFDSWTEPIPELRAEGNGDRHLIYEGDGVILDLLIREVKGGTRLHVGGQVLPEEITNGNHVFDLPVLLENGKSRSFTHTNALGEFTFQLVPNGSFDLTIVLNNKRFCVRGLSNSQPMMWRVEPSLVAGD